MIQRLEMDSKLAEQTTCTVGMSEIYIGLLYAKKNQAIIFTKNINSKTFFIITGYYSLVTPSTNFMAVILLIGTIA